MVLSPGIFYVGELFNRLTSRFRNIQEHSCQVDVLYPASTRKGLPSKHLAGQLDRITAVAFDGDIAKEVSQFLGGERDIGPTKRIIIRNVFFNRGVVYSGFARKLISSPTKNNSMIGSIGYSGTVSLKSSFLGCYFFGHWLRDDCATTEIADDGTAFFAPSPNWPDKAVYLDRFGINLPTAGIMWAKRLIIYDDVSQNQHKIDRVRKLRQRLGVDRGCANPKEIVYVKRGSSGEARKLLNENQIVAALQQRGVYCASPEDLLNPLVDQIRGCRLFISIEGSQISHAIYSVRDGGGVLVLQPPHRFFNSHMDWASPLDLQYGSVVGIPAEGGFIIPVDDILRTIDLYT
jgi:hypothetical protein